MSMYDQSFSDNKMVNICSQTDETWCQFVQPPSDNKVTLKTRFILAKNKVCLGGGGNSFLSLCQLLTLC